MTTAGPCCKCGHEIPRNRGYVLVNTLRDIKTRHLDGECVPPPRR